jgi:hypothetical protein
MITNINRPVHNVRIYRVHLVDDTVTRDNKSSSMGCPSNPYTGATFSNPIPAEYAAIYLAYTLE